MYQKFDWNVLCFNCRVDSSFTERAINIEDVYYIIANVATFQDSAIEDEDSATNRLYISKIWKCHKIQVSIFFFVSEINWSKRGAGVHFIFTQNSDTRISSVHFPSGDVNLCCVQMRWQAAQLWKLSDDLNPISDEKERERAHQHQRHQQQPSWQNFPPCKTFIFSLSYYLLFHPASEWQIHHAPFKISSPRTFFALRISHREPLTLGFFTTLMQGQLCTENEPGFVAYIFL